MAEQTTPLAALHDEFDRARGEAADGAWAYAVSWRLLIDDVAPTRIHDALEEALALVRDTGESPQDLFGEPGAHADALVQQWLEDGSLELGDATEQTWPEAVRLGLAMSAAYAGLLAVVHVVRDGLDSLDAAALARVLAIAAVIGLGSALGLFLWSRRHHRRPGPDATDDERWSLRLTEILRTRYALSGPRVRGIVADARAHLAESGRTAAEEFGTPTEYAAGFAPDRARRSRLWAAGYALLAVSNAVMLVGGSWIHLVPVVGFTWLAVDEHRKGRAQPQSGR